VVHRHSSAGSLGVFHTAFMCLFVYMSVCVSVYIDVVLCVWVGACACGVQCRV